MDPPTTCNENNTSDKQDINEHNDKNSNWNKFISKVNPGSVLDRIVGMIFGHALGDAMGLPWKFKKDITEQSFPYKEQSRGFQLCDWSQNTDHMIIIMQALISGNMKIFPCDIAARFRIWQNEGFKELGDTSGVGLNSLTAVIINHPKFLEDPYISSAELWKNSKGNLTSNGSLTRTSIVGSFYDAGKVLQMANDLSAVTHVDEKCRASCVMQSLMLHYMIYTQLITYDGISDIMLKCVEVTKSQLSANAGVEFEQYISYGFSGSITGLELDLMAGMSSAFKCMSVAAYVMQVIQLAIENDNIPSFEKVIKKIVSEGGDTESNAAIAGSVLGSYLGYSNLPSSLIKAMPNHLWLGKITTDYISTMMSSESRTGETAATTSIISDIAVTASDINLST